jgi:hypothetical protein
VPPFSCRDPSTVSLHVDPREGVDHHADEGAIAQPDERRFIRFRAAGAGRAFSQPSSHENSPRMASNCGLAADFCPDKTRNGTAMPGSGLSAS